MQLLTDLRSALTWLETESTDITGDVRADLHRIVLDAHNFVSGSALPVSHAPSPSASPADPNQLA